MINWLGNGLEVRVYNKWYLNALMVVHKPDLVVLFVNVRHEGLSNAIIGEAVQHVIRRKARKGFTRIFGSNDQAVWFYPKTLVDRHKIPKSTQTMLYLRRGNQTFPDYNLIVSGSCQRKENLNSVASPEQAL